MKILGVDPGTWHTGIGVIEAEGSKYHLLHFEVIHLPKNQPLAARLKLIYDGITEILRIYQPSVLALENIFFGRDLRAMVKIGEARACAMLAAAQQGVEVLEYPPARVKQAVSGNGRATKEQIQFMIQKLLGLKSPPPVDGSDALALAICHLHTRSVSRTRKEMSEIPVRSVRNKKFQDLLKAAGH